MGQTMDEYQRIRQTVPEPCRAALDALASCRAALMAAWIADGRRKAPGLQIQLARAVESAETAVRETLWSGPQNIHYDGDQILRDLASLFQGQ
jgi:hypothetical protein